MSFVFKRATGLTVLLLLLAAPALLAQTTGRIEGRVLDEDGSALPGATVTIKSPSLQGERFEVTDNDGRFRFLAVPVGDYKLSAKLDGFGITEYDGIAVRLDKTVTIQVELAAAVAEVITVTSDAAALIDQTSTTSGANFSDSLVQNLPLPRTAINLAFAAPGVVDGGIRGVPSISGASVAENRYVIDGLDTTDPAFGTPGYNMPTDFMAETEVKTGGYEAEYGGALGGLINVITKSGGNALSLDAFAYYSDDSLQSDTPRTETVGQNLGEEDADIGLGLGGRIIEDKLWFFAGVNSRESADIITTRNDLIQTKDNDEETLFYAGKLTWQISSKSQLAGSVLGDPTDGRDVIRNSYGLLGTNDDFGAQNLGLRFDSTLTANAFLELAAGRYDEDVTAVPFNDVPRYDQRQFGDNPGTRYLAGNPCGSAAGFDSSFSFTAASNCLGATFAEDRTDRQRDEFRGSFTYFAQTGSVDHELKIGTTVRNVEHASFERYPGPLSFAEGGGVDSTGFVYDPSGINGQRWLLFDDFTLMLEFQQGSEGETNEEAIYLQDALRIGDRVTLNLGVRADSFDSKGGGFDFNQGRFVNVSEEFPDRKLDFSFSDMVAPRIGFTVDLMGDGRSKLFGHFGRFYESVPLDINVRAFGTEIFNFFYFYYPEDGSLPTAQNPGTWFYSYPLGVGVGVSSDIKPMYTEEALVGFEYGVTSNIAIGVKYTDRSIEDVIEDISVDGGNTYFITNPGGTVTVNPVTGEPLDEAANFPVPSRNYKAIELTLNKRFSNNWQLVASYVNSENEGNYGGLFRQDNGQLDPNITSLFDLPSLLDGAFGPLPNDREHQFKTYGSYLTPFDLSIGWYAQFLSGTPISQLGGHPIYGLSERFVTPRGSFGRTEDLWNIDLHIEYPIKLRGKAQLRLIADVFNIFDEQSAATVDQDWTFERLTRTDDPNECGGPGTGPGTACPSGNPNFGTPLTFQRPQTIRFGVKLSL